MPRIRSVKGTAVLFFSLLANGTVDASSLHGSCPVLEGQKWVGKQWIKLRSGHACDSNATFYTDYVQSQSTLYRP